MSADPPSKTAFSETDLAELDWVLDGVCAALKNAGELDDDKKRALRRRLFMLVCNGMNDPQVLRDHLIVSFERSEARNLTRKMPASWPKLRDPAECRQRAMRCADLAVSSSSSTARERYHDLAKTWLALAVQLEAQWALVDEDAPLEKA
jgi:hypothetical protein